MHDSRRRHTGAPSSSARQFGVNRQLQRACRPVLAGACRPMESLEQRQLLTLMMDYRLDEGSGDTIIDSAPDGGGPQDGFINPGVTRIAGRVGSGALSFNGTGSATVPGEIADYLGRAGSISFWIRTTQTGGASANTSPAVTGTDEAGTDDDGIYGWIDNTGRIAMTINGTVPAGGTNTVRSTNPINNGTWQHVVMTHDGDTGQIKVYVNGILQQTGNGPIGPKTTLFRDVGAARLGGNFNYLTGSLDEVRVYDHVLDDAEAALAFNPGGGAPAAPTNLASAQTGALGAALTWNSTADNESGFRIFQQAPTGGTFNLVGTVGSDVGAFVVKNLSPNTSYTFRVVAFNPTGESAPSNDLTITTGAPATTTDNGTGLTGIYFDDGGREIPGSNPNVIDWNDNFKGKIVIHAAEAVNFNWGNGSPDPGIAPDNFSSRWLGTIKPLYSQNYTFYSETDDGGRLYIDRNSDGDFTDAGELVIEDPTYHGIGAANEKSSEGLVPGGIPLVAGQSYNVRFEQFERAGGAAAFLKWDSISQAKEVIPASQLFPLVQSAAPTGAATGLAATSNPNNTITIDWTDAGVQGQIGYRLERRATGEAGFTEIASIADTDTYTDTNVYPGKQYTYRIRAFNLAGNGPFSNEASINTTALPTGPGLLGSYHDDRLFTGPAEHVRVDADRTWNSAATGNVAQTGVVNWPDIDAAPESPLGTGVPGIDDGANISIRWEGTFTPTTTGPHTFFSRTDDDVRLYINGQLHVAWPNINNFNQGGGAVGAPGTAGPVVELTAGTAYPVLMEYNQGTGGARAELRWKGPGMATPAIITQANLNATVIAPVAASNVTATPGAVSATVSWTDNSRSEWQTIVEQSLDGLNWGAATVSRPSATFPTAVSNPNGAATPTSVLVIGLQPTTTYHFRVRQVNTAGEAISTNAATTTTLARPASAATVADNAGDTNLSSTGTFDWVHWGHGGNAGTRNASTDQFVAWEAEDQSRIAAIVDGSDGALAAGDGRGFRIVTAADTPSANGPASTANGGGALYADEEVAAADSSAWVIYNVTFAQPGMYRLYARVRHENFDGGDTGNNNSARQPTALNVPPGLTMHGTFDDNVNVANVNYRWVGGNTLVVPAAGTYTFTWGNREGGFMTDSFILHQNTGLSAAQLDAMTTNRIGPISPQSNIGTGTVTASSAPGATFSWTDGTPNGAVTQTDDGIAVTGAGNGFFFTVPAVQADRTLKVFVAADDTTARFNAIMSDGSIAPYTATIVDPAGGGPKTVVYTIPFRAEQPGQSLRIELINEAGTGQVILQAATLTDSAPAAPTDVAATVVSPYVVTLNFTDAAVNEGAFRVERSTDGATWTTIGNVGANGSSFTDLDAEPGRNYQYRVVAVNAGGETASAPAAAVTPAVAQLPAPFKSRDIGTINNPMTGSATYDAGTGTYTIQGGGTDIWNNEDHFHYVYRPATGDVTMTARVTAIDNTDVWAKIGIMFREDLSNVSQHVIMGTTPANGTRLQGRRETNYHSFDITTTPGPNGPVRGGTNAPVWVKLERVGDTFNGYYSTDGQTWTLQTSQTIDMADAGYIGLAVTSHDNTELNLATIDNVTVVGGGTTPTGIDLNGTAANDNWYLKRVGDQVHVWNNADGSGTAVSQHALGQALTLNGLDGDDTVTVDMSGGDIDLASLTITGANGNDTIKLTNGDGKTLTLGAVPTLNGEYLDLGTADLKLTGVQAGAVEALLKSARDGAVRWQGPGIGTSSATADTGLAPVQQGADTLVKYSYNGDANGDGRINADDYFRIDSGFLDKPANPLYVNGDFNFDDQINADDYFLIDSAFLGQTGVLGGSGSATSASTAAAQDGTAKKAVRKAASRDSLFSSKRIEKRAKRR